MTSNYAKDDDNSYTLSELHAEQDLKAVNRPDAAVATTGQELCLDKMPKKRVNVALQGSAETLLMSITDITERYVKVGLFPTWKHPKVKYGCIVRIVQMRQNSMYNMYKCVL